MKKDIVVKNIEGKVLTALEYNLELYHYVYLLYNMHFKITKIRSTLIFFSVKHRMQYPIRVASTKAKFMSQSIARNFAQVMIKYKVRSAK